MVTSQKRASPSGQDEPLLALRSSHGWTLGRGRDWADLKAPQRALAAVLCDLFEYAAQELHGCLPLPAGSGAHATLGGAADAGLWDMREDALGFQAVASGRRFDEETCEDYYEVNERSEAVINLDALVGAIVEDGGDAAIIEAALVTLPHEMFHVAAWLNASGGRSPLQVFDQEGGENALRRMLHLIERQARRRGAAQGGHGHAEDEAETFGRRLVDRWVTERAADTPTWRELRVAFAPASDQTDRVAGS